VHLGTACELPVTDDTLTPASSETAPSRADANGGEPRANVPSAIPEQSIVGAMREERAPGLGVIVLSGIPDAPGEDITLGCAGANNHSPSISGYVSDLGQLSRISIAWIESPAGDTSGIGGVMLQRLNAGPGGGSIGRAALALAANDNAASVADLSGASAVGCAPAVAELTTGDTVIGWIGADGHVHGRLYPPAYIDGAADAPAHARINAALDDLGHFGEGPDGARRLQVAEVRPGTFAIMWLALAQGGPVLRGSLLVGPTETNRQGYGHDWIPHAIPDVPLPPGFAGPVSIAFAGQEAGAYLEASSETGGTIAFTILGRDSAGATVQAATSILGQPAVASALKAAVAPVPPDAGAAQFDAPLDRGGASGTQSPGGEKLAAIVLSFATTPGVNETAPLVETVHDGFAIAWQAPGATDQARQIKLVLYDAAGAPRGPEILVADNAAAGVETVNISALEDGLAVAYVDASNGALVVKAYAGDGTQIGQDAIVAWADAGAIVETALAANAEDELAVVYRQQDGGAGSGVADYGSIMMQRYRIATVDGETCLVELGDDDGRNAANDAILPATAGDDASALVLAAGRAPAVIGVGSGFAIAWVENDGTRETIKCMILDGHGAEVQSIDVSLLHGAEIAEGTEPTLLDAGGGSLLVSWLQPDADDGYVVMAAVYRETAPGAWLAPDEAVSLKAFSEEPDDYAVSVSSGVQGFVINVTWDEHSRGPGNRGAVYTQRYDLDGRQLGDATRIAERDAAYGEPQHEGELLAATGLADGQVVVVAGQGSGGDYDLLAHLVAGTAEVDGGSAADSTDVGNSCTFTARVGEETAIDPLVSASGSSLIISHINGVPITTASPVDVGFGWVQLREDGGLTVTPDAGYRGRIAFDYSAASVANGQDGNGHVVVDVGVDTEPTAVTLLNQVTAVAEDVSTTSALKVADIAMTDGELETDGLSLTGLDAGMFEIVGNALYLKQGIELDFETKPALSVEILAAQTDALDAGANFTLNIAGAGAAALVAASDMLVFEPGYSDHPLIELSLIRDGIFQELMDAGALTQEGENVVVTLNPDDPAELQKIVLKGAALGILGDVDF
jgi:hypothetical protein